MQHELLLMLKDCHCQYEFSIVATTSLHVSHDCYEQFTDDNYGPWIHDDCYL